MPILKKDPEKEFLNQIKAQKLSWIHPPKKPIKSSISVHDSSQLETIFDYNLWPRGRTQALGAFKRNYRVEVFMILPPQIGVNERSYSIDGFYADMRPMLRLREPRFIFEELIGQENSDQIKSPLVYLREFVLKIDSWTGEERNKKLHEAINDTKFLACSFVEFVNSGVKRKKDRVTSLSPLFKDRLVEICDASKDLLRHSYLILKEFEILRKKLDGYSNFIALKEEMDYGLEYCAYVFKDAIAQIFETMELVYKDLPPELAVQQKREMRIWVKVAHRFYKRKNYPWLQEEDPIELKENYVIRYRSLKRRISKVLYLSTYPESILAFRKQLGYMLAAGFAALWATLSQIWILAKLQSSGGSLNNGGQFLGVGGAIVIFALVVAYILKDRIKDLGKQKLQRGVFSTLPDHQELIRFDAPGKPKNEIGVIKEYACFLKSFHNIPEPMRAFRCEQMGPDLDEDYEVIHYKKDIELDSQSFAKLKYPIFSVRDIMRFNVGRLIKGVDDPIQSYMKLTEEGQVEHMDLNKIYPVDLLISYSFHNNQGHWEELALDCKRLILNKSGLIRIHE